MRLYRITPFGRKVARSVSAPSTEVWTVLRAIDKVGTSTDDQLADMTGLTPTRVRIAAGMLQRKGLIEGG